MSERVHREAGILVDLVQKRRNCLLNRADADAPAGAREENRHPVSARAQAADELVPFGLVVP